MDIKKTMTGERSDLLGKFSVSREKFEGAEQITNLSWGSVKIVPAGRLSWFANFLAIWKISDDTRANRNDSKNASLFRMASKTKTLDKIFVDIFCSICWLVE